MNKKLETLMEEETDMKTKKQTEIATAKGSN